MNGREYRGRSGSTMQGATLVRRAIVTLAFLLTLPVASSDQKESQILGTWLTEEKDGIVRIYQVESGSYEGQVVSGTGDPNRQDVNHPDPKLRSRPLMGKLILRGFKYDGDGKWSGGTIYDPNNGKTYKSKMELAEPNLLRVRGYVGTPIFGRTSIWVRHAEGALSERSQP